MANAGYSNPLSERRDRPLVLIDISCILFFFFRLFAISRATSVAYGGSQARGLIGAVAAGLHHSHSNMGAEPHLPPTPQLKAMPDP